MDEIDPAEVSLFTAGTRMNGMLSHAERASRASLPVSKSGRFRAPDGREFVPDTPESTAQDRQRQMVEQYMSDIVASFGGDIWAWSFEPEDQVLKLLDEPLAPETRVVRRNLVILSTVAALVAWTGEVPAKIPGIEFELAKYELRVMAVLLAVLLYELAVFFVYAWGDSRKNSRTSAQVASRVDVLWQLAEVVPRRGARVLALCPDVELRERVRAILAHFQDAVPAAASYQRGRRLPGLLRRWVDFLLPPVGAGFAAVFLTARLFNAWNLWWWALVVAGVALAVSLYRLFPRLWRSYQWRRRSRRAKGLLSPPE
jgi:hypothetical protein